MSENRSHWMTARASTGMGEQPMVLVKDKWDSNLMSLEDAERLSKELAEAVREARAEQAADEEPAFAASTPAQRVLAFAEAHGRRSAANGVQPQVVSTFITIVDDEERTYELAVADLLAITEPDSDEESLARMIAVVGEPEFGPDDRPSTHDRDVAHALLAAGLSLFPAPSAGAPEFDDVHPRDGR